MKIIYWVSKNLEGPACFNIRARTREECTHIRMGRGKNNYGPPSKISIDHYSKLDLIQQCLGDGAKYLER